jgi:ATP-dependent Clp protease ATP-binding subunit ClpC
VEGAVKRFFRPEFLNRLTGVVVFHQLEMAHIREILDVLVERLNGRLSEKGVTVKVSPAAVEFLISKGLGADSGARGLEHVVEKELSTPLSKLLLGGNIGEVEIIRVDHKDKMGSLTIG